jgi:hypothetical protein
MTNIAETQNSTVTPGKEEATVAAEKPAARKNSAQKKAGRKARKADKEAPTTPCDDTVATSSAQIPTVAPAGAKAPRNASQKKNASRAKAKTQATPKPTNKKAEVIAMMKRSKGATLAEIVKVTGWQAHTVRGFVSILASRDTQKIESSKNSAGERTYTLSQ